MAFRDMCMVCFVLSLSQIVVTQNQDFCQTFADNDFNIDYGYQTDYWSHHFLVIGSHYWKIEWEEDRAKLTSGLSRTTDLLGKQFRTAFLSNFSSDDKRMGYSMTGRLFTHNNTIDWIVIRFNMTSGQLVRIGNTKDYIINRTEIQFEADFNSSVSLMMSLRTTCFLQQRPVPNEKPIVFEDTYRCFQFDYLTGSAEKADILVIEDLKTKMDRKNISYANESLLNNLRDNRKVIAILSEYYFSVIRYLFLFKVNKSITYCLTSFILFNKECETRPELLIDCSDYETRKYENSSSQLASDVGTTDLSQLWTSKTSLSYDSSEPKIWEILWYRHKDMALIVFAFIVLIVVSSLLSKKPNNRNQVFQI